MNRTLTRIVALGLAGASAVLAVGAFGFGFAGGPDCVGAQTGDVERRIDCGNGTGPPPPPSACASTAGFSAISASPRNRGLRIRFARRVNAKATVDLFQQNRGRRILGNRRVALFRNGTSGFSFSGKKSTDGVYIVRFRVATGRGRTDFRRLAVERRGGRFRARPDYYRRASCDNLSSFKLERPVFGGSQNRALNVAYRLGSAGQVTVTVRRGTRVLRRFAAGTRRANRTYRLRIPSEGVRRGDVRVQLKVGSTTATLTSKRL